MIDDYLAQLDTVSSTTIRGSVARTTGMAVAVADFPAPVGGVAEIALPSGDPVLADVVGFQQDLTVIYPLAKLQGVRRGAPVRLARGSRWLKVGAGLLGRAINAHGKVIDEQPVPILPRRVPLHQSVPPPVSRPRIDEPLSTGVRAVDGLLSCGRGQRMGIFAGSGVGKSVLLGMLCRNTAADVNVIALVGERGREVNDFIERDLGPEGLQKSVVVVATSDESPLSRVQAAFTATAIAEYFRDEGKDVLLVMDSLTRVAMAQREIGLSTGEPPTTRGYPPSVFSLLPKLVERAGRTTSGSITAFYSVLVEGDDANEPISDTVRGLLDGHTWLSRRLASAGHYPAIDVLESVSRLMPDISPPELVQAAGVFRRLLATYREHEDLISIGAYRRGSNATVDMAIQCKEEMDQFLQQKVSDPAGLEQTQKALVAWAAKAAGKGS